MLQPVIIFLLLISGVKEKPEIRSEKLKERIEKLNATGDEMSLIDLAIFVETLGEEEGNLDIKDTENLRAGRAALLSVPRYSERIVEFIQKQTQNDIEGNYSTIQWRGASMQALAQIRTPESLNALGTLLSDERDPWKDIRGWGDGGRPLPNSYLSMISLAKMKIRNPPTDAYPRFPEDIIPWQTWFDEVRSGKRAFSFEGDPQFYTLAGPVAQPGRSKPTIMASSPAAGMGQPNGSPQWPLIVVVLISGVGAVVLVLRTRKALRDL